MKSWRGQLSFVGLATVAVALLVHGCQSPEPFHLGDDAALSGPDGDDHGSGGTNGTGGKGTSGTGGSDGTGGQGSGGISGTGGTSAGTGGRVTIGTGGVGGRGAAASGGTPGFGGRTTGTAGHGGRAGTGGAGGRTTTATGGRAATGGAGGRGGRSGAGGRNPFGLADGNCITEIQTNGYASGTAPACSACKDNGKSLQTECEAVIDCMEPQWPCTGNCLTQCYNMSGASSPVMSCVSALTTAACGT